MYQRDILKLVVVTSVPPILIFLDITQSKFWGALQSSFLPLTQFLKMAGCNSCPSPLGRSDSEKGETVLLWNRKPRGGQRDIRFEKIFENEVGL